MNDHRPQVDMPRFNALSDEQDGKMAGGRPPLPAWNREQLIRQFQHIDGSTRSEAERQVDGYERSFRTAPGGSPIAGAARDNTGK